MVSKLSEGEKFSAPFTPRDVFRAFFNQRLLAVNSTLLVIEAHVACTLDLPSSFGGKTASTAPTEFGREKKGGSLSLRSEERLE